MLEDVYHKKTYAVRKWLKNSDGSDHLQDSFIGVTSIWCWKQFVSEVLFAQLFDPKSD